VLAAPSGGGGYQARRGRKKKKVFVCLEIMSQLEALKDRKKRGTKTYKLFHLASERTKGRKDKRGGEKPKEEIRKSAGEEGVGSIAGESSKRKIHGGGGRKLHTEIWAQAFQRGGNWRRARRKEV